MQYAFSCHIYKQTYCANNKCHSQCSEIGIKKEIRSEYIKQLYFRDNFYLKWKKHRNVQKNGPTVLLLPMIFEGL